MISNFPPVKRVKEKLKTIIPFFRQLKKAKTSLFSFLVCIAFFLFLPGTSLNETLAIIPQTPIIQQTPYDNFKPAPFPEKVGQELLPEVSAKAIFALDKASGVTLIDINSDEKLRPASITKLMTALVALSYYSPDQILTVKRLSPVPYESDMGLAVGDSVSVRNLVYGLLIPSGGDAAYTLADNYPGGIENFLYSMNKMAEKLHMQNSHFDNPSGFDSPGLYSSARDVSFLTRAALDNEIIGRAVATFGLTLSDAAGQKSYSVKNVNQFLGYLYGADGVKTGTTDEAGQCLASSVTRDGHRIIVILLKSTDRFGDSGKVIEWIFRNFHWNSFAS